MNTIRTRLLKVGATIRKPKRRIYYRLSRHLSTSTYSANSSLSD
ncbi:MAG: hypothetical protein AAGI25_19105 [Bacteroidota bacterium]